MWRTWRRRVGGVAGRGQCQPATLKCRGWPPLCYHPLAGRTPPRPKRAPASPPCRPSLAARCVRAGCAQFTFHIEAPGIDFCCHTAAALCRRARGLGMLAGIALTPETAPDAVFPLCAAGEVDTVLLLSVRAGFGGQKFQPGVLPKVAALRRAFPVINIIVDGGITLDNAGSVARAGANALVAGTTVFAGKEPPEVAVPGLVRQIAEGRAAWPRCD